MVRRCEGQARTSICPSSSEKEEGHGRIERRTTQLTDKVRDSWFPYAAQGLRIERTTWNRKGRRRHEVAHGVITLAPGRAAEARVLGLVRGPWTIGALHHLCDVTRAGDELTTTPRAGRRLIGDESGRRMLSSPTGLLRRALPGLAPRKQLELSRPSAPSKAVYLTVDRSTLAGYGQDQRLPPGRMAAA